MDGLESLLALIDHSETLTLLGVYCATMTNSIDTPSSSHLIYFGWSLLLNPIAATIFSSARG